MFFLGLVSSNDKNKSNRKKDEIIEGIEGIKEIKRRKKKRKTGRKNKGRRASNKGARKGKTVTANLLQDTIKLLSDFVDINPFSHLRIFLSKFTLYYHFSCVQICILLQCKDNTFQIYFCYDLLNQSISQNFIFRSLVLTRHVSPLNP